MEGVNTKNRESEGRVPWGGRRQFGESEEKAQNKRIEQSSNETWSKHCRFSRKQTCDRLRLRTCPRTGRQQSGINTLCVHCGWQMKQRKNVKHCKSNKAEWIWWQLKHFSSRFSQPVPEHPLSRVKRKQLRISRVRQLMWTLSWRDTRLELLPSLMHHQREAPETHRWTDRGPLGPPAQPGYSGETGSWV